MIEEQTVFILGAGASTPYGFPTGKELRRKICQNFFKRLKVLIDAINDPKVKSVREESTIGPAKDFVSAFEKSGNESIDLWLNRNKGYSGIGKLAIALNILNAERASRYYENVADNEDWCLYLYRRMTDTMIDDGSHKLFKNNKVTFITFNYDRSLEYYLYECLTNSFTSLRKSIPPINELFPFRPLHVFGKIADLPWESSSGLDYRCKCDYDRICKIKDNIRTIFEDTDNDLSERIRGQIAKARRVFFLGFGYHRENLEILGIPDVLCDEQYIYGTALGFTDKEIKRVRENLNENFPRKLRDPAHPNPTIKPINCYGLLREHL